MPCYNYKMHRVIFLSFLPPPPPPPSPHPTLSPTAVGPGYALPHPFYLAHSCQSMPASAKNRAPLQIDGPNKHRACSHKQSFSLASTIELSLKKSLKVTAKNKLVQSNPI